MHEGPKAWWLYAAQCHGFKPINNRNQPQLVKDNDTYIEIYSKIVKNPNEVLSTDSKDFKDRVEKERSYDELRALREVRHCL